MRVILNGEHAGELQPSIAWIESCAFVNCLRHELCLTAHWLQFNSWSEARNHGGANSWCVSINSFIKNEQSKNRRRFILLLLLFFACNKGFCLAHLHLTGHVRSSHLVELSNSPLKISLTMAQVFSYGGYIFDFSIRLWYIKGAIFFCEV